MDIFSAILGRISKGDSFNEIMNLRNEIDKLICKENYQTARDKCEELMSEIKLLQDDNRKTKSSLLKQINQIIFSIREKYIPECEIMLGIYVNAEVKFKQFIKQTSDGVRLTDAGFEIVNEHGNLYTCYIKEMHNLNVGDKERLWITNIKKREKIIYLEPRIEKGDIIFAEIKGFSFKDEPYFRFLSYDGFIKKDFSGFKLAEPDNFYKLRVEYSRLATKCDNKGKIFRIGVLFANPLERISESRYNNLETRVLRENS